MTSICEQGAVCGEWGPVTTTGPVWTGLKVWFGCSLVSDYEGEVQDQTSRLYLSLPSGKLQVTTFTVEVWSWIWTKEEDDRLHRPVSTLAEGSHQCAWKWLWKLARKTFQSEKNIKVGTRTVLRDGLSTALLLFSSPILSWTVDIICWLKFAIVEDVPWPGSRERVSSNWLPCILCR